MAAAADGDAGSGRGVEPSTAVYWAADTLAELGAQVHLAHPLGGEDVLLHLSEGFDFLGVNVRRYRNGKLLITPGPAAEIAALMTPVNRSVAPVTGG